MSYKQCPNCKAEKDRSSFYSRGANRVQSWCKACYGDYDKRWRKANREKINNRARRAKRSRMAFIYRYKLAAGCFDCGYNSHSEALQFDHVIGKKSRTISELRNAMPAKLISEINKCVVRCANCHAVKTRKLETF